MKAWLNKWYMMAPLSGILAILAWPPLPMFPLIFIAFVPILHKFNSAETVKTKRQGLRVFGFSYLAFLVWNTGTSWWVCNSTVAGGIMAFALNSLFMATVVWVAFGIKQCTNKTTGYLALTSLWIAFEFLHLRWDLSWSWLNLGNVFAMFPATFQWYEFTGVLGGTLWILLVNILIYEVIQLSLKNKLLPNRLFLSTMFIILLPIVLSLIIFALPNKKNATYIDVAVIQPNIDPYFKFNSSAAQQIQQLITLSENAITQANKSQGSPQYIVWPETALPQSLNLSRLAGMPTYDTVRAFVNRHPQVALVTGIEGFNLFKSKSEALNFGDNPRLFTSKFNNDSVYKITVNAATLLNAAYDSVPLYLKSKLVPGVEKLPFPKVMNVLAPIFSQFGGTTGGYSGQKNRTNFLFDDTEIGVAICYESVYGEFVTEYVKAGANVLMIVTNDGWWGNTAGHKQHLYYASLRAVENRRGIARSANTGISGFVNANGQLINCSKYEEEAIKTHLISLNNRVTFYSKYGDFIGRIALLISLILLLFAYVYLRFKKQL